MRLHPKIMFEDNSPNQSERSDRIRAIVLHSTESHTRPGTDDLYGVASWLCNPASQASAHVIVDDDGTSARLVPDERKAWHCAAYNSATLGIEQIGFAAQGKKAWLADRRELDETARWIAHWSRKHGIPIRRGKVSGGQIVKPGVLTHAQLGIEGGGHHDPGSYPIRRVLRRAKQIKRKIERNP